MPTPNSSSGPIVSSGSSKRSSVAPSATIGRKINGDAALEAAFLRPLWLGERVMTQKKRDPLPKIYALHAPEVECIGKGKAHKPYEFGVKVSVATTLKRRCKGGQFAIHAKALPGRPYDGHTLETVIPEIEDLTGATLKRILADAGYRGHNAPGVYKLRVFTAGQKRRVTPAIKRQMKRRSAVEPVIGHIKNDHRDGSQSPRPRPRRRHQPHPRRRRLQLPPHPQVDQSSVVPALDSELTELPNPL